MLRALGRDASAGRQGLGRWRLCGLESRSVADAGLLDENLANIAK